MLKKTTIAAATLGGDYYIRRGKKGRRLDHLGELVEKEPHTRASGKHSGWDVVFRLGKQVTYRGFAGGATALLEAVRADQ